MTGTTIRKNVKRLARRASITVLMPIIITAHGTVPELFSAAGRVPVPFGAFQFHVAVSAASAVSIHPEGSLP